MDATYIKVCYRIDGLHCYPDAPDEVAYLKNVHQHFFDISVAMQVFNDDREIELHMFRRWMQSLTGTEPVNFGSKSCETIARELHAQIIAVYPGRAVTIEVSEDGVCGVVLTFNADTAR